MQTRGPSALPHFLLDEASTHPYSILRPRAPAFKAAPRGELVDDQLAAARGTVGLVVYEALVRDHFLVIADADGAYNRKPILRSRIPWVGC